MKQKAFLLKSLMVIGLLGCTVSVYAQSYEVDRGRAFFERKPIPYADARTFVDLGCGYAKDSFSVFYHGRKIDASAGSFKLLDGGYAKDAFTVFYFGKKVDGASAGTFKYTGDGYAKDAFNDYYRGRKLE